ncbi:reverse transcriptase domain-containing protein [Tanacetum coccineum]
MPSYINTYDGSEDSGDHLKIFQAAAKTERYDDLKKAFLENYLQQKKYIKDPIELHNIKQRGGESTEYFVRRYKLESRDVKGALECMRIFGFVHGITNPELIKRLHDKIPKTVDEMMRVTTSFLRGKWQPRITNGRNCFHHGNNKRVPRGKILRKEDSRTSRGQKGSKIDSRSLQKLSKKLFALRNKGKFKGPPPMTTPSKAESHQILSQKITSSSVNDSRNAEAPGRRRSNYPKKQQVGSAEIRVGLRTRRDPQAPNPMMEERVKCNLDIFAWKPADMIGVLRHIAEHRLNVREGCSPVRQKKRGQAADRNQTIQEEVGKLVEAGIIKEVHYHDWLSNPVMVKNHDDIWRMCVDFKDLNKACPKDGYPLPEIDWLAFRDQNLLSAIAWKTFFVVLIPGWHVTAIEKLIRRLSLVELEIATNQFDNRSIIGYGNMGIMYKAVFPDRVLLAVKMLHEFDSFEREYFIEINVLGRLQQTNLIPLLGFCYAREKKFLVYKYMNNGSLHQWLHCCSKLHSSKEKMGNIIIASSVSSMLAIGKYQRNKTSSNSCTDVEDNAGDM